MKLPKPATAEMPSAESAAALVAQLKHDTAALETKIAISESERDAKALELNDDDFEAHVLETERAKRSLLRLTKQLESAEAQHAQAEAREKEGRRHALYEAGLAAEAEVERLASVYADRAAAVAQTLIEINKHAETIRIADDNRPLGTRCFDVRGLGISHYVVLPRASKDGVGIWDHGPVDPPKRYPGYVFVDGVLREFDENNAAHVAARAAEQSKPVASPPVPSIRPVTPEYGFKGRPDEDGVIRQVMSPCEWPSKPDPETKNDGRRGFTPVAFN